MEADRTHSGHDQSNTPNPNDVGTNSSINGGLANSNVVIICRRSLRLTSPICVKSYRLPPFMSLPPTVSPFKHNDALYFHFTSTPLLIYETKPTLTDLTNDMSGPEQTTTASRTRRRHHRVKIRSKQRVDTSNDTVDAEPTKEKTQALLQILMAENFRVSGSIGLTAALMLPTTVYLDTCSGVNVINRKFVPTEWLSQLKPVLKDPRLGDANSNPIVFDGMLTLTLRFANRAYRVAFYVARHFAVDVLVGTAFHNRYIKGIFPIDQRVTFENDESVPMLQSKNNAPGVAPSEEGAPNASPNRGEAPQSHTVRVARRTMIPPQSQISVHVKSQAAGLSYLSPKASLLFRHNVRVANGIAELTPGQNFEVIIATSEQSRYSCTKAWWSVTQTATL